MKFKDLISPFYVWKRAFEKPFTTIKPLDDRPGAANYRGFHTNDMDKCIGCGTCESICQNEAIDMVPAEGIKTTVEDSGLRPKVDYGRCCWCGLCVDICPSESLRFTNEYKWPDDNADAYRYIPGYDKKPWDDNKRGYRRDPEYELLTLKRQEMEIMPFEEGIKSFSEMVKGYSLEQARKEADRCTECGLCIASCPGHMNIPAYIEAIRHDDLDKAIEVIYKDNCLPASCGRICTRNCEEICALGRRGDPIAIRWLKRYIIDQVPFNKFKEIIKQEFPSTGKKIAIIGAGPAGLSCGYYLAGLGHQPEIFEMKEKGGGMLRFGVPSYRLPYEQLDQEVEFIKSVGVKVNYNTRVGTDIELDKLLSDYDAVFFATGLTIPYDLGIEGEKHSRVLSGLQVLDDVTYDRDPNVGKKVAVIGGGNVAMDAARVSLRMGAEVSLLYRRRVEDMPADDEEIHESQGEGVKFITQAIPIRVENAENPNQVNLVWGEAKMEEDPKGGRPRPVLMEDKIHTTTFDSIISAIGQEGDFFFLKGDANKKVEIKRGKVLSNQYGQTAIEKLFVGGDISNNVADAISAIADGHNSAKGIDKFLRN